MADIAAGRLAHAPVVYVLAAIRFEPLEALPNWIVEIQEELRLQMPMFRRVRHGLGQQGIEVAIDPPDFDVNHPGSGWVLSTVDAKTTIQLSRSALVVHTTNYTSFSEFIGVCNTALTGLLKRARQINVNHIGIRYLDHLRVLNGMGIDKFVPGELMPHIPNIEGLEVRSGVSLTTYSHGSDSLNVRFSSGVGMPVIPEDLLAAYVSSLRPENLGLMKLPAMEVGEGVLDTDCSAQNLGGTRFAGADEILNVLDRLHKTANAYFRAVTTQAASDAWSGTKEVVQ